MKFFSKPLVGVDIGARTLKGVTLRKAGGKVHLERCFLHDLANGNELFPMESTIDVPLLAIVETHGLKGMQAATCLNDRDILNHDLTLPPMPKGDFELAIRNDVEENFGLTADEAVFDYLDLGTSKGGEGEKAHIYKIYCAKKTTALKSVSLLAGSKLETISIEASVLAQTAMLKFNEYIEMGKDFALIDFGETHTTVSLISDQKVLQSNVLTTGFGSINQVLFETQGLSYEMAEKLKLEYDMNNAENEANENHKQIDEVLGDLLYKIKRLIGAFQLQLRNKSLSSIFLTGGGCQLPHLDKAIESYCGSSSTIVNPFRKIEIFKPGTPQDDKVAKISAQLASAVGLALRGL